MLASLLYLPVCVIVNAVLYSARHLNFGDRTPNVLFICFEKKLRGYY